jgi:hypothetical protein
MKIAIHGAEGTGKEVLAAELSRALDKRGGHQARIAVSPPLTSTDIAITFVCGLDWTENDSAPGLCAGTLTAAGIDFQVVYGTSDVRVANALRAIDAMTGNLSIVHPSNAQVNLSTRNQQKWRWECDKCGDSSCEHRLFSELIR